MKNYRIAKNQNFIAGEEIRREKITKAERVANVILWLALAAIVLIYNIY